MTRRESTRHSVPLVLAAVLALALLPVAYLAGYFWLGGYASEINDEDQVLAVSRDYGQQWQANLFQPAGKVEAWLRRIEVTISGADFGRVLGLPRVDFY